MIGGGGGGGVGGAVGVGGGGGGAAAGGPGGVVHTGWEGADPSVVASEPPGMHLSASAAAAGAATRSGSNNSPASANVQQQPPSASQYNYLQYQQQQHQQQQQQQQAAARGLLPLLVGAEGGHIGVEQQQLTLEQQHQRSSLMYGALTRGVNYPGGFARRQDAAPSMRRTRSAELSGVGGSFWGAGAGDKSVGGGIVARQDRAWGAEGVEFGSGGRPRVPHMTKYVLGGGSGGYDAESWSAAEAASWQSGAGGLGGGGGVRQRAGAGGYPLKPRSPANLGLSGGAMGGRGDGRARSTSTGID